VTNPEHDDAGELESGVHAVTLEEELRDGTRRLRAMEDRLRALFEGNPQPMWIYDRETLSFLAVNDAALHSYGYTRDEFMGMTLKDIRPDEDLPLLLDRIADRPTGFEVTTEWRHRAKGGALLHVEIASHDVELDGRPGRLVLAHDITLRKRAEHALRESERRFREMLENVQLVAVVLDSGGRITFCNDYVTTLTGHAREDVLGHDWFDLFIPEARREGVRASFLDKIGPGTIAAHDVHEIVTKRGELRMVSWSNTMLRGEDGRVAGTASIGTDITEQKRAEEKLLHDALHDSLTGLPNRTLFLERLDGALSRHKRRENSVFAVLFVDLDRFKVINESLGHAIGDQLLIEAGRVLSNAVGPGDTVARLGGDEFTVLLDDIGDELFATRVANKIHEALMVPFDLGGHEVFTTASIGIALSATGYERPEDCLRDADTAMYRAKARGKSRHEIFDKSMHKRALTLLALETDLRRAVERQEFQLVYQPIVAVKNGAIVGFEALIRWRHPKRGMIPPVEFIPIAEETGLIIPIGRWVLREACLQMRKWTMDLLPRTTAAPLTMSVNLSGKQFLYAPLPLEICQILEETGLEPSRLKLEITESVLMENAEAAAAMLRDLRGRGIQISIDDFGTGYSSLSYLLRFPIDTLKIDRTFVSGMADQAGDAQNGSVGAENSGAGNLELVRAIVTLARNLGMDVVAEGVETEGQRIRLEALGCQHAQGYLFSPPVDGDAAQRLLLGSPTARKRPSAAPPGE
jgi:diguanylate cyclase (GGDEF)-like protein/PAS domain S-box-containing protein